MKTIISLALALTLFLASLLSLYGCAEKEAPSVTDGLTVEPSAIQYSETDAAMAAEHTAALLADAVYTLRGIALTEEQRAELTDTVRTRFLPVAAGAGLSADLLFSTLCVLEEDFSLTPEGVLSLYGRLSVLLSAKTAGDFLYGVCELCATLLCESYEALVSQSPIFEADLSRAYAARAALTDTLGRQSFGDMLSVLFFGAALLTGSLQDEGDGMLRDGEILGILSHHADYYSSLSLTAADFAALLQLLSFFTGELTSDRRTPFEASLCELAVTGKFSSFAEVFPAALAFYAALSHTLTEDELAALRAGEPAPLFSAMLRCDAELTALLLALDAAALTAGEGDFARIEAAGLTAEYAEFLKGLATHTDLLSALADGDTATVRDTATRYFASLLPALTFLYGKENTP